MKDLSARSSDRSWTQPPFEHGYDIIDADTAMKVVETLPFRHAGEPDGTARGLRGDRASRTACRPASKSWERSFAKTSVSTRPKRSSEVVGVFTPIDPRE